MIPGPTPFPNYTYQAPKPQPAPAPSPTTTYAGPYSPAVYSAANQIRSGSAGAPYSSNIINAANNMLSGGGKVLGESTSTGGNGGGGSTNQPPFQQLQSQQSQGLDLIEQDYQNALGALGGQEQSLRGQADTANQQIASEAGQVRTQLGQAQGTAEQGIQSQQQTAETGAKTAMQQARDLFRQTQQQNIAQLSALGISSSSVQEALAERLGVETARRIAGVTGSLQEVRQNASQELARTKDYYQQKLTDLENQVQVQKANIQNSLIQGLNQINSARNQAATDKARGRQELINNTQNAIAQLSQQQQQFQQSLQQWASQKTAALTPIVTDPNFINSLSQATSQFNQQFAPSGFQYAPQLSTDAYGQVKGPINYTLQKKPEELANPFAQ